MMLYDWWHLTLRQVAETDWVQWLAVALGIAEVLLAKVNNIALYPAGIASTILAVYILLTAGLYAESLLNGYYIVMSIYGWWFWIKKKNEPPVQITRCSRNDWLTVTGITVGSFVVLALSLARFTTSTVPTWDAWVSATAWAGMWLLAKRKIENWILLNVSNICAIPLLFYKKLPLFAGLTIFLFIIGVQGYFSWRKIMNAGKAVLTT
jgi:nicotinamide mononucleotide transporter